MLVTTLPAKAGSFSGHARRNRPRSVLKAPSEPKFQDVLCGVNVPVGHVATALGLAPVYSLRERLFNLRHSTAAATYLGGIRRINRHDSRTSFFRFVREYRKELRPTRVVNGLRKVSPGYSTDVQGFVGNQTMGVRQLPRLFVVKVPALVSCLLVQLRHALASFATSGRALLLARERALCPSELLLRLPIVTRRLYGLTLRGDEKRFQTQVNAYLPAVIGWLGRVSEITREDYVPLPTRLANGDGLDLTLYRPVLLDLEVADVLKIEPPVVFQQATVAVGRELDRVESAFRFEPRIARRIPGLHAPEERLEGFVQFAKCRLGRREVEPRKARQVLPGRLESRRLLTVAHGAFFGLVHVAAISKSKVVQPTMRFKHHI